MLLAGLLMGVVGYIFDSKMLGFLFIAFIACGTVYSFSLSVYELVKYKYIIARGRIYNGKRAYFRIALPIMFILFVLVIVKIGTN